MEYIVSAILALLLAFALINFIDSKRKVSRKRIIYRQSDNHNFLKEFFSRNTESKINKTQISNRKEKYSTKVVITHDDKAYWVNDNIFYVSDVINGQPDFDNAKQIDTSNMSKKELDKMLFILDNLSRGDKDERGSTWN